MACRNLLKLVTNKRIFYKNIYHRVTFPKTVRLCPQFLPPKFCLCTKKTGVAIGLSLLTWLGFTEEDENKESELIMTLKRAVLCIKREQFNKAEQMLHLALRLAQQQQNHQGVVYCYDLMANLALDQLNINMFDLYISFIRAWIQ